MKRLHNVSFVIALVVAVCVAVATTKAWAEDAFFKDKQIKIVLPTGSGGGWAFFGRLLSEYMGRYIPGNPTIVLQFMPGASGVKAMNYLANAAPQDGTYLGLPLKDVAATQLLRKGVRYDAQKFHWIGRMGPVRTVMFLWHKSPATTIEQARKVEVVFGGLGKFGQTYMNPTFMNYLAGTKFRVITGYRGSADLFIAMQQGEAHGWSGSWAITKTKRGDWLKEGKLIPIVQFSLSKAPDLADVPLLMDFAKTGEQRSMVEFMVAGSDVGRSLMAPARVPTDRVETLRSAFSQTMKDEGLLARAAKARVSIEPLQGPEVAKIIKQIASISPATFKDLMAVLR